MILEGNYIIFNIWTNTKIFCIKESAASKLLSWYSYMTLSIIYVSITSNTNKYQQTNIFVYNLNYKKFQRTHTDFEEVNFKNYGSLGFGESLPEFRCSQDSSCWQKNYCRIDTIRVRKDLYCCSSCQVLQEQGSKSCHCHYRRVPSHINESDAWSIQILCWYSEHGISTH